MNPNWLYHDDMYRFDEPESSYWEATAGNVDIDTARLEGDRQCEVAVIGGGYTGLSAAYHLARDHDIEAHVLEAGHIGWGASGRNAGFCCIGASPLDLEVQVSRYGLESTRHFYRAQVEAVELVRSIIDAEEIDTPIQGDAEIEVAVSERSFDDVKKHAERQFRLLGLDTEVLTRDEMRERCFDTPAQFGAAFVRPAFGLHPMRYIQGLAAAAEHRGAKLYAQSEVVEWQRNGAQHLLRTKRGSLNARYVIVATNGFTPEHLHAAFKGRPLPMISAMFATRRLSDDELAAHRWQTESTAITARVLLNYFRLLPDRRFLFGGRGHSTGSREGAEKNYSMLVARFREMWPEWRRVEIDYRWHGLICLTRRLTPSVGRLPDEPSVFFGFGYHGNGVNTATWTGKMIADWLGRTGVDDVAVPEDLPLMMRDLPGHIPVPSLRLFYIWARLSWYRVKERLAG